MRAALMKRKTGPDLIGTRFFLSSRFNLRISNFQFQFSDFNVFYAVAAFTCDNAAATSFKSGTTGMS
jgi:hypothetical protein